MVSPNWILLGCASQLNGACMQYSGTKLFAVIVAVTVAVAVAKRQQLNEFIKILSMNFIASAIYLLSICTHFDRKYVWKSVKNMLVCSPYPSVPHFLYFIFRITFRFVCADVQFLNRWRNKTKQKTMTESVYEMERKREKVKYTHTSNTNELEPNTKTLMQHIFIDPVDVCTKFNICRTQSVKFCHQMCNADSFKKYNAILGV